MLDTTTPWDMVAEGYAQTTKELFRPYAEAAIHMAKLNTDSHILDVACGPGTLSLLAKNQVKSIDAIDFSESMVSIFEDSIKQQGIEHIKTHCGDAQVLPYADNIYDAAFSMFGLMFFPDRAKGYSEIYRTLKPGGRVIISSWAPVAQSSAMQTMFGAVRAMKPEIPEPQTVIDSLENPEFFKHELEKAGFKNCSVEVVTGQYPVNELEQFWNDMLKGSAPIVMMKNSMPEEEWIEKERIALDFLKTKLTDLPTVLTSDALLGYGIKA